MIVILGISAGMLTYAQANDPRSENLVRLAYFYKPPDRDSEREFLVENTLFDLFILTRRDERFRDELLQAGGKHILQYVAFERIHDPCMLAGQPPDNACKCDEIPNANNVGWRQKDICWINEAHADWYLRDSENNVIHANGYVFMDVGHQEWRAFFLDRIEQVQHNYDWYGVFLDNVRGSLERLNALGVLVPRYPTDEAYLTATRDFICFLHDSYFQPEDRPLFANLRSIPDNTVWVQFLPCLDGAMDEFWAVGWGADYLLVEAWEESLKRAELTLRTGDEFIAIAQGNRDQYQRQTFAFASYLLIANGNAMFRFANTNDYDDAWFYENYQIDLGEPLGGRYQRGDVWQRDFMHGYVEVNPLTHEANIVLWEK